ncbi:replication initiator protein [Peromfec virus RodF7_4]|uniref:Replication initiator protein n=1 Tax=Peromfec virus RodF7_4 TaxID=2929353 RepID=A0A976N250_9VIRU|nr:replication initiator protein [Peromfec virus RodF7_4]
MTPLFVFNIIVLMQSFVHQRCLQPVAVFTDGKVNYYPCGHCSACQLSYQSSIKHKLEAHINTPGVFAVFITLTYDNDNLPLVYYDADGNIEYLSVTNTRKLPWHTRNFRDSDKYDPVTQSYYRSERVRIYLDEFDSLNLSSYFLPHFVLSRHNKTYQYDTSNSFAICYLPDIQKFIKRLRFSLSCCPSLACEDTSLSYFICSEYGPQTYRPHYHGLLFFRSSKVASKVVDELCAACWSKQDHNINALGKSPIASHVLSASGSASYVSDYVTMPSDLLPVFKLPCFRPFRTQSKTIPLGSESFDINDVPDMLREDDILCHKSFYDTKQCEFVEYEYPYPNSSWSRVFPKFLLSGLLDVSTQYRIFWRLHEVACTGNIPDLRPEVSFRYGVGFLSTDFDVTYKRALVYKHVTPADGFDSMSYNKDPNYLALKDGTYFRRVNCNYIADSSVSNSHYITPSEVVTSLDWIKSHLDYYLFGFNQNLTACRKIIRCMQSYDWCRNPLFYCSQYLLYFTKVFSNSLRSYYDGCLSLSSVTPFDLYNIYYSFFHSLPQDLSAITAEQYDFLDMYLYNYGFDFTAFYDSDGQKYSYNFLSSSVGVDYLRSLDCRLKRKKTMKTYNHDLYNCK